MNKFLMICYVAADFGPYNGEMFSIKSNQIGTFIEAPEWIKETLMFKWLLKDGSIKVADEGISRIQGENDPMKDMGADGKAIKKAKKTEETEEASTENAPIEEAPVEEKPKTTRAKRAKKDDAK